VSVAQAKSRFAALVARAEAGETIVVTRSAQARAEHLALLTRDKAIIAYGAAGAEVFRLDDQVVAGYGFGGRDHSGGRHPSGDNDATMSIGLTG